MNLFFLHLSPSMNAKLYINKHCVKIILECVQMLYTTMWMTHSTDDWVQCHFQDIQLVPYKATHRNHPTTKWTRLSIDNFNYMVTTGLALCEEYTRRYKKIHKCQVRLEWLRDHPPTSFSNEEMTHHCATKNIPPNCTPVPLAMPKHFYSDDLLYSYRMYYVVDKSPLRTKTDTLNFKQLIEEWNLRDDIPLATLASF
jgi:hypothetical protein